RQDAVPRVVEQRRRWRAEADHRGVWIRRLDPADVLEEAAQPRARFRVEDSFERELDVVRGERLPIVPLHVFPKVEGVRELVTGYRPLLGQSGNDLALRIVVGQAHLKDAVDDRR